MSNRHTESKKTQLELCPCLLPVRVGLSSHWPSLCLDLVPSATKTVGSGRGGSGHQGHLLFAEGGLPGVDKCICPGWETFKKGLRRLGECSVPSLGGYLLCCMEGQEVRGISGIAQGPACRPAQGEGSLLAKVREMGRPRVHRSCSHGPVRRSLSVSLPVSLPFLQPGLLC